MKLKLKFIGLIGALLISSSALFGCGNSAKLSGAGNSINESMAATDGKYVYYTTKRIEEGNSYDYFIYKSKLDGSEETELLTSDNDYYTDLVVSNNYIYYVSYSYDTRAESIMRVKSDGTEMTKIIESGDMFENYSNLNVVGDYIYYQKTNKLSLGDEDHAGTIMKSKVDGSSNTELIKNKSGEKMDYLNVSGDYLYYSSYYNKREDASIIKVKLDGTDKTEIITSDNDYTSYNYLNVSGNDIYYVYTSYDRLGQPSKNAIMKLKNDGTEKKEILLNENNEVFGKLNVYNGWVYYVNSDRQICKVKLDGSEKTELVGSPTNNNIIDGLFNDNYSSLCIIDNVLYYKMFSINGIKLVPMKMNLDGTCIEEL